MISDEAFNIFLGYLSSGMTIIESCKLAGFSPDVYYDWKKIPEKMDKIKEAMYKEKLWHLENIKKGAENNAKLSLDYIQIKYPKQFNKLLKTENKSSVKIEPATFTVEGDITKE